MNTGYIISDFYLSHTLNHIHKNPKLNAIEAVRCMFGRAVCWLKYNDKCDCIKSLHFLLSCISSFSISIRMHLTWLWLDVIPYVTSSSLLLLYTGAKKLTAIVSLSVFVYKRNLGHTERTERKNIIMFCKLKPSVHTDTLKKKILKETIELAIDQSKGVYVESSALSCAVRSQSAVTKMDKSMCIAFIY